MDPQCPKPITHFTINYNKSNIKYASHRIRKTKSELRNMCHRAVLGGHAHLGTDDPSRYTVIKIS